MENYTLTDSTTPADLARLAWLRENIDTTVWTLAEQAERSPETFPSNATRYLTVDRCKAEVTATGSHYFERDTMRWHHARVSQTLYGARFMVESTGKPEIGIARMYRVIWVAEHVNGSVSVEKSVYYPTRAIAHCVARDAARLFV